MKKKQKKYSNGGQLLAGAASFIPGIGQIIAPLILAGDQMRDQSQQALAQQQANAINPLQINTNPFGKAFGGPLDPPINLQVPQMPISNTFVAPRPMFSNVVKPTLPMGFADPNVGLQTKPITEAMGYDPTFSSSSHSKSHERFREKALGGPVLNDGFKQYNTGSHSSGNDQNIDQFGNPTGEGIASIQNKENMFNVGGKPFIMSDTLTNSKTGNKFSVDALKINNKFPEARFQPDQKNTLEFEMGNLALGNNMAKSKVENKSTQLTNGGFPDPPKTNSIYDLGLTLDQNVDYMDSVPPSNNLMFNSNPGNINFNSQNEVPTLPGLQLPTSLDSGYSNRVVSLPDQIKTNPQQTLNSISERNTDGGRRNSLNSGQIANGVALATKGYALGQNIVDAIKPAEQERLILPDYGRANNYFREANIDYSQARQDATGASNILSNVNRSMSGNASAYQARQANRVGALQDTLSRISEAQNNAQSQLNVTKGQYETNKAADTAQRKYQNQQGNMQNAAMSRYADRNLASNLSQIGTEFNQYSVQQDEMRNRTEIANLQTGQAIQYMQAKYPSITFSPESIEAFKKGEISLDQLIKVKI